MSEDVYRNVRNVPAAVKQAVYEDAVKRGVTMSDVVGQLLAEFFRAGYHLSGEKSMGVDLRGSQFRLRMPEDLSDKIVLHSRKLSETESSVIIQVIADHFGLEFTPVKRGRRAKAA